MSLAIISKDFQHKEVKKESKCQGPKRFINFSEISNLWFEVIV